MRCYDNGTRFKSYCEWGSTNNTPYNYERYGLLKYLLSSKIINTNNETLRYILKYYEQSIIFLLKYIDRLKHFKNYHWKNR